MSQPEQNKTAEETYLLNNVEGYSSLFKHSYCNSTWAMVMDFMREYASQQTASLQKQHREESVKLVNIVREQYQKEVMSLQKQVEEQRIQLSNYAYQMDIAKRDRDKAEAKNERFKKQVEELRKERDEYRQTMLVMGETHNKQLAQVEQLEAENERLKSLLNECDSELAVTEDYEHGERGHRITELRWAIQKALNPQDNQKEI